MFILAVVGAGALSLDERLGRACKARSSPSCIDPMRQSQDRQPVTLNPAADDAWLDLLTPAAEVKPILARNLDGDLESTRQPVITRSAMDWNFTI